MKPTVKKIISISFFVLISSTAFTQSKKKQILLLNKQIDSVQIDLNQKRIYYKDQIKELTIKKEKIELELKNSTQIYEILQNELTPKKNDLYSYNLKILPLNLEVLNLEDEYKKLLIESKNW
jgi:polyhydroxyalkanoate synthesis regulator phasin